MLGLIKSPPIPPIEVAEKKPQRGSGGLGLGLPSSGWLRNSTSIHATIHPGYGLFPVRLTPRRQSGHLVSRLRRPSPSPPSFHPRPTTCEPLPRRRHPARSQRHSGLRHGGTL